MSIIRVSHPTSQISGRVRLNGSKSISNRVLIIKALCEEPFEIHHLSNCDDTITLNRLLSNEENVFDAHHAGTTFRFLTSYLAIRPGQQELTGSDRMKQRPIGQLVNALRDLGADIEYLENEGYPPLKIGDFKKSKYNREINVKANISSQYITSLLLIAPVLPEGLLLHLDGDLVSESYLNMTLSTLGEFGIQYKKQGNTIEVPNQKYKGKPYTVEADWSACSYFFSIAALADKAEIILDGLFSNSIQGDSKMRDIGALYGIKSFFDENDSLHITKESEPQNNIYYDFINQPDLAQTVAVMSAGIGAQSEFSGLKTLRIKETDRIAALQTELQKINSDFPFIKEENGEEFYGVSEEALFDDVPRFSTYKDHRMAMAFAPLALMHPIEVEKPEVVSKSYPLFWKDLESLGFVIEKVQS